MFGLDFDIDWRPWRAVYVALIGGAIVYWTGGDFIAGSIALLGYFDINPNGISES